MIKQLTSLCLMALVLSGCATLSETECVSGNWYQIGYQDGKYGRDSDYVLRHESACVEYGVMLDRDRYEQGRQKGLEVYCTAQKGFQHGVKGSYSNQNCVVAYPEYLASYREGLIARYDNLQAQLDELQHEHEILRQAIRRIENEEEKDRLRHELDDIDDEMDSVEEQISRVNHLLNLYQN